MAFNKPIQWSEVNQIFDHFKLPYSILMVKPSPALAVLDKTNAGRITERGVEFDVMVTRGYGTGPGYPSFNAPKWTQGVVPAYINNVRVEFELETFLYKPNPGSFITPNLDAQAQNMKNMLSRMIYGDGTGVFARVASVGSGYLVINPTLVSAARYPLAAAPYFWDGMLIDFYRSGTKVNSDPIEVVKSVIVDNSGTLEHRIYGTFTGVQVNDVICCAGYYNAEFPGLMAICNTTTPYANINPSTYPSWAALVEDAGGETIGRSDIISFVGRLSDYSGGEPITHIFTTPAIAAKYGTEATELARVIFTTGNRIADAGYSGLQLTTPEGVIPVIADRYCPAGCMFFVSAPNLGKRVVKEFDWNKGDPNYGGILMSKIVAGSTNLVAFGTSSICVFTTKRNAFGLIKNISEAKES